MFTRFLLLTVSQVAASDLPSLRSQAPTALTPGPLAPFEIFPNDVPGETGAFGPEQDTFDNDGNLLVAKHVSVPTLTVYPVTNADTIVVVLPGGAYSQNSIALEGTDIAAWLNGLNITAAVLKYRVPARPHNASLPPHWAPLMDAQRAVGLARQQASSWGVPSLNRVGVIGFSAGGHLNAHLNSVCATAPSERLYPAIDDADSLSCRADFQMLIYPAYLTPKNLATLAPELSVGDQTPRTFLSQAADDHYFDIIGYYLALQTSGAPKGEMHAFPKGGHGYGRCKGQTSPEACTWPQRAEQWMRESGFLDTTVVI